MMEPIDPRLGLHQIETFVNQLEPMAERCREILKDFEGFLQRTWDAAPDRRQGFRLSRGEQRDPHETEKERRLEKAFWKMWRCRRPDQPFFGDVCEYIQMFQVPLFARKKKDGWGYVDLLGVTYQGFPVVIELKTKRCERYAAAHPCGGTCLRHRAAKGMELG